METKQFEITHLSFRLVKPGSDEDKGFYIGNVVFRVFDSGGKEMLDHMLKDYEVLKGCRDLELLKKYENNLKFEFGEVDEKTGLGALEIVNTVGLRREDVYEEFYRGNDKPLRGSVVYNRKFNCYCMRDYYQDNPVVRGIISYLEYMKDYKPNPSRTVYYQQLLSTLENLCWWWD